MVDVRATESNEIVDGEVVGDGDDENESGTRTWGRERRVGNASEQMQNASAFAELGARV